jgi:hypothetical protein
VAHQGRFAMKKRFALALLAGFAGSLWAQAPVPLETKTIELKHLKPTEAVSLLRPYLVNGGGNVSSVSENMPIITIKDVPENITRMEKVLAKYDHSPATIRLVFQLIEADTGPRLINAAGTRGLEQDLELTLRSVLRFSAYRVVAQGVATSGEFAWVGQQLAKDPADGNYTYDIRANVGAIRLSDATLQSQSSPMKAVSTGSSFAVDTNATGSVRLNVELVRTNQFMYQDGKRPAEAVMSTGLDVPLGNTVVLGTATSQKTGVAIILTVKPELVRVK